MHHSVGVIFVRLNLLRQSSLLVGIIALTLFLNSCGGAETEDSTNIDANPVVQGEPIAEQPDQGTEKAALEAGSYCYRTEEKTIQAIAELLVEPNLSVSGTLSATITNDAEGYYTSYEQAFAGVLKDDTLSASITTEIENDVQKSQETWTLTETEFGDGKNVNLKRVSCEEIIALKSGQKEPKAIAQAPQSTPPTQPKTSPAPQPKAQPAPTASKSPIRVQFPQGGTETTLKGQLSSGQNQVYRVNASEGQDMFVQIAINSGTANFDVEVDNGEVIEQELSDYLDFTLPFSGDYIITVRGTAPNTTYNLTIRVK